MGGRYRAVLIGNSTYPADAHNLQTLKGPVKDIAVLNRALVDPGGGFFADVDVTLLPEVSSTRAIRALSKFFGEADRDDVLLVYFSGHGKLDQRGRLHLCMQDTETTDLLSTAVSSVRINEFAEASRARNVVIILDCCYAGAFRSSDLGDAVAGPGRYVMTSCRSTELANDATVDNGTSFFTQHLVDGLLNAADHDEDGYVRFSDLYGYVDRRLREAGKQIPQRRVEGDGDLPLAKRARRSSDEAATTAPVKAPALPAPPPPAIPPAATDRRSAWPRKRVLAGIAVAVALIGGGVAAWLTLGPDGAGAHSSGFDMTYTAAAPWRVRIDGTAYGNGCTVALTHTASGEPIPVPDNIYGVEQYQITRTGAFRLHVNDRQCFVTPLAGSGKAKLPVVWEQGGDTDAFAPPAAGVRVEVTDFKGGSRCALRLFDATSQAELDTKTLEKGSSSSVIMDPLGRSSVYLFDDDCTVKISAPD